MLDELNDFFSEQELDKYFRSKFFSLKSYSLLTIVSYAYRITCKDPIHAAHYGHPVMHIGIPKMIRSILKAYHDTKAHLKEKGTYSSARQRIMSYCTLKAIIQVTSKTIIRSIIEPLGIWKILHYFRNY